MASRCLTVLLAVLFSLQAGMSGAAEKKPNGQVRPAADKKAPVVDTGSSLNPSDGGLINNAKPVISAEYMDDGIGVSPTETKIYIDEQDVSATAQIAGGKITYTPAAPLADGTHKVRIMVVDKAGNASEAYWSFTIHTQPPQIKITSHKQNQFINKSPVLITGTINDPRVRIVVNGINAMIEKNLFSATVNLIEGNNTITAVATDAFGNTGSDAVVIVVDTKPPHVEITRPAANSLLNTRVVTVTGVTDKNTLSVLVSGGTGTETVAAELNAGSFTVKDFKLAEGANAITVKAISQAGNTATATLKLTVDSIPPVLTITMPKDFTVTNRKMMVVSGTVDKPNAFVKVNNTPVQVSKGLFTLSGLNLAEGTNVITATAVDRAGNEAKAAVVNVVLDTTPPAPPTLNAIPTVTRSSSVTVTGTTEPGARVDIFTNSAPQGTIKSDEKGAFSFTISLTEGNNAVSAVAYDGPGNASAPSAVMNIFLDTRPPKIL